MSRTASRKWLQFASLQQSQLLSTCGQIHKAATIKSTCRFISSTSRGNFNASIWERTTWNVRTPQSESSTTSMRNWNSFRCKISLTFRSKTTAPMLLPPRRTWHCRLAYWSRHRWLHMHRAQHPFAADDWCHQGPSKRRVEDSDSEGEKEPPIIDLQNA